MHADFPHKAPHSYFDLSVVYHSTISPYIHMDIWLFDQLVPHFREFLFRVTATLTSPVHPFKCDPEGMIVEVLHLLYRSTDTVVVIGPSQFSIKRLHEYRELDVSVFFSNRPSDTCRCTDMQSCVKDSLNHLSWTGI